MNSSEPSIPETAWDVEVDKLVRVSGITTSAARDMVILTWLKKGDTRPFTAFVTTGHHPAIEVVRYIAWMLNPADGTKKQVPFRLKIDQRGRRGARASAELDTRDRIIYAYTRKLMNNGVSYDLAIDQTAAEFGGEQRDLVEKIYKNIRKVRVKK